MHVRNDSEAAVGHAALLAMAEERLVYDDTFMEVFDETAPGLEDTRPRGAYLAFEKGLETLNRDELLAVIQSLSDLAWELSLGWALSLDEPKPVIECIRSAQQW